MTNTITIQEALREIKLTEKKIAAHTGSTLLVSVQYADRKIVGNVASGELFKEKATSTYQSTVALIKRYHDLKGKIAEKNATTTIKVANRNMSVSAAIEYKTSLTLERGLLKKLQTEQAAAIREVNQAEQRLTMEAEQAAAAFFGTQTTDKKSTEDYTKFVAKYKESRAVTVADPIGASQVIQELSDFLDEFEAEIDNLLTLNNVNTTIEVD